MHRGNRGDYFSENTRNRSTSFSSPRKSMHSNREEYFNRTLLCTVPGVGYNAESAMIVTSSGDGDECMCVSFC